MEVRRDANHDLLGKVGSGNSPEAFDAYCRNETE
jgi:hypothetical protein